MRSVTRCWKKVTVCEVDDVPKMMLQKMFLFVLFCWLNIDCTYSTGHTQDILLMRQPITFYVKK